MAGDIKWIKVITDIFEDEKVKLIKSMPEGRTLVLLWFQLLIQAGKTNAAGWIYLSEGCAYTPAMLATLFNETQQMVELALKLFSTKPFDMIEITEDGLIYIPNWEKHQNVESMDKIREKERLRKAKQREKQKLLKMSRDSHGTVHGTSHESHATEVELEVELEKENNTTLPEDPFEKVRIAFKLMHKMIDMPYKDSPLLTDLLKEFPADLIIGVMKDKFRENVRTLKYYEGAIRDTAIFDSTRRSNGNNKAAYFRPAPKIDSELDYRRREIAFNKWVQDGGNPDEFEYGHASNH
ncbi:phage replisome organizer N-terminal domain-containing protein [Paenibacillus alkaliterrae]|uniref:phage replisome organizer N-terminal domain-containing protein n=1 Tax=Paenibacillus alkaliterrae TaxID=320909 RepID=UPI001F28A66E|nr:phage replisome organizer N-terminal domain-containing protein [Paenibacillus alkaliterrae]MCF2938927.1 phage replisome organizer N-terminal domain-containing protein [Paenibacillus alkaliterrae]